MAVLGAISTRNRADHSRRRLLLRLLSSVGSGILASILLFQDSSLEFHRCSQTTSLPAVKYDRMSGLQGGVVFVSAGLVRPGIETQESRDALPFSLQDAPASDVSSGGLRSWSFAQLRGSTSLRGAETQSMEARVKLGSDGAEEERDTPMGDSAEAWRGRKMGFGVTLHSPGHQEDEASSRNAVLSRQADSDLGSKLPATAVATSFLSVAPKADAAGPKPNIAAKNSPGSSTPPTETKSVSAAGKGDKVTTPDKPSGVKNGGNASDGKAKTAEKEDSSQAKGSSSENSDDSSEGEGDSGSEKEDYADDTADGDEYDDMEGGKTGKENAKKESKAGNAKGAERGGGSAAQSESKGSMPQNVASAEGSKEKGGQINAAKSSKEPPKAKTGSAVTSPSVDQGEKAAKPSKDHKKDVTSSGSHDVGSKGGKSNDSNTSSKGPTADSHQSKGEVKKPEPTIPGKKKQSIHPHEHGSSTGQQKNKGEEKATDKRPISTKVAKASAVQLLDKAVTERSGMPKQSPPGRFFVLTDFETRARDRSPGETLKVPRIINEGDHEMMMMSSHQPIVLGSVTPDSDELLHGW